MTSNGSSIEIIKSQPAPRCFICGSEGQLIYANLKDRLYGSSEGWNIRKCVNPECGLLWLDPLPLESELWKAYSCYYTHGDLDKDKFSLLNRIEAQYIKRKYTANKSGSLADRLLGYIMYFLPTEKVEADFKMMYLNSSPGGKLLDVGCGNGWFLQNMKRYGWDVSGVDLDPKAVEYCNSLGLNAYQGALETVNFPSGSFDVVVLNHTIEHVYRAQVLLDECFRILKKGGSLRLSTPNSKGYMHRKVFKSAWYGLEPPRHLYLYNRGLLESMALRSGFKNIYAFTTSRNDYWIYTGSKYIASAGSFKDGKHTKLDIIIGKLYQLRVWLLLFFNKDAGGEVHLIAEK